MNEFTEDVCFLKDLYALLLKLQVREVSFEERFHIVCLRFPLESIQQEKFAGEPCGHYLYCFFVNQKGIRHLPIAGAEARVADKIKNQSVLSREEKIAALSLLRKLAV
jgi:hypothetical protein